MEPDFPAVSEWYRLDGSEYDDYVTNVWTNETVGVKLRTRRAQGPFQHKTVKYTVEFRFLGGDQGWFTVKDVATETVAVNKAYEFAKENNKEDNT